MSEQLFNETVGAWIKRERESLGLTRQDVADGIRVTATSVTNWESGKHAISAYIHQCLKAFFKQKAIELAHPEAAAAGRGGAQ